MAGRNDERFRCSFCGKPQEQVHKLIAGPNGAYICDECVEICAEIIEEEMEKEEFGEEESIGLRDQINLIKKLITYLSRFLGFCIYTAQYEIDISGQLLLICRFLSDSTVIGLFK